MEIVRLKRRKWKRRWRENLNLKKPGESQKCEPVPDRCDRCFIRLKKTGEQSMVEIKYNYINKKWK
jgi:hypothetical protein